MPEPNETEIEALRKTVTDLLAKKSTHKSRIAELEKANAELQTKFGEASASLHRLQVDIPLQEVAKSVSTAPELWAEQLAKYYKTDLVDGKLTLLTKDDKPVMNKDGKPVSLFDAKGLSDFLCDDDDAKANTFRAITIANRASGGAAKIVISKPSAPSMSKPIFALGIKHN